MRSRTNEEDSRLFDKQPEMNIAREGNSYENDAEKNKKIKRKYIILMNKMGLNF
jgi:hypothetical protein